MILDFNNKQLRTQEAAKVAVRENRANPLWHSRGLLRNPQLLAHRIFAQESVVFRLNGNTSSLKKCLYINWLQNQPSFFNQN